MAEQSCEFFKLDETDRRVFFWLIDHVHFKSTKSWISFIVVDYRRRNGIQINAQKLCLEASEIYQLKIQNIPK